MPAAAHKTKWAWAVGTFFGVGFLKPGPGTYGSLAAIVLWCGSVYLIRPGFLALSLATTFAALIVTLIGISASTIVAREAGPKDPGFVVIDEVAGQLIALIAVPANLTHVLLSLVLFRLFDIWKPWPIRRLEAIPAGAGIMLDDVAAGLLALLCAQLARLWF